MSQPEHAAPAPLTPPSSITSSLSDQINAPRSLQQISPRHQQLQTEAKEEALKRIQKSLVPAPNLCSFSDALSECDALRINSTDVLSCKNASELHLVVTQSCGVLHAARQQMADMSRRKSILIRWKPVDKATLSSTAAEPLQNWAPIRRVVEDAREKINTDTVKWKDIGSVAEEVWIASSKLLSSKLRDRLFLCQREFADACHSRSTTDVLLASINPYLKAINFPQIEEEDLAGNRDPLCGILLLIMGVHLRPRTCLRLTLPVVKEDATSSPIPNNSYVSSYNYDLTAASHPDDLSLGNTAAHRVFRVKGYQRYTSHTNGKHIRASSLLPHFLFVRATLVLHCVLCSHVDLLIVCLDCDFDYQSAAVLE